METLDLARTPAGTDIDSSFAAVLAEKRQVADDAVKLTLRREDGLDFPAWSAGAHIDLEMSDGLTRQYSLCGDPADLSSYTVAVLKAPKSRGGSLFVHDSLQLDDDVAIHGPRNHFPLVEAEQYLFIAGGIGITPIAAMIREVQAKGKSWRLEYGGRTLSSMAFHDELSSFGHQVNLWPQDAKGTIDLPSVLSTPDSKTAIYACGPEPLLAAVEGITMEHWPSGALHLERFAATNIDTTGDTAFEVELATSGIRLSVAPDQTLLQALDDADIRVLSQCREGTCGTCETPVVEGAVDHRDSVLDADEKAENSCMMVCVSRAACPLLVLDL